MAAILMRKLSFVLFALCVLCAPCLGSIAFDAVSNSGFQSGASSYSWNHTCTGTNLVLIVSIGHNALGSGDVTGVTYNGVALTHIAEANNFSHSEDMWFLLNPATGTNSIQVTYSATLNIWGSAVSLTGVAQTGQPDANNTAVSSSTNVVSGSITTVTANAWIVTGVFMDDNNNAPASLSPGTTDQASGIFAGNFAQAIGHDGPVAAGATSLTWSEASGSSARNAMVMASFAPAGGGPAKTCTLSLLGAGPC